MKLKTLKDLQKEYIWNFDTYEALKQEAIKWIKEIRDKSNEHWLILSKKQKGMKDTIRDDMYINVGDLEFNDYYDNSEISGSIKILKHIFNIKEEDLNG